MKIYYITLIVFVVVSYSERLNAQQSQANQRHIQMIKFLLSRKELTDPTDTILSNLDVMFDRKILTVKSHSTLAVIYIFGSNSPHGKYFVALEDYIGLSMLQTKDLAADLHYIVDFFKRNNVSNIKVFTCLNTIADMYKFNSKQVFISPIEEKH
jgi:hypothetical protein